MGSENLDCEWMIDIVERLRKREFAARVVKDKHEIYRDAADTIWRAQGKIARLRAENEKLRKALKPFAHNYQNNGLSHSTFMFAMKDLLAAKKALGDTDE